MVAGLEKASHCQVKGLGGTVGEDDSRGIPDTKQGSQGLAGLQDKSVRLKPPVVSSPARSDPDMAERMINGLVDGFRFGE